MHAYHLITAATEHKQIHLACCIVTIILGFKKKKNSHVSRKNEDDFEETNSQRELYTFIKARQCTLIRHVK